MIRLSRRFFLKGLGATIVAASIPAQELVSVVEYSFKLYRPKDIFRSTTSSSTLWSKQIKEVLLNEISTTQAKRAFESIEEIKE